MAAFKHRLIGAGFKAFSLTGLHRMMAPLTRGQGAILTFHRVQPWQERGFAPNRLLEITPDHLDAVLGHVKAQGYRIVPLDEIVPHLAARTRDPVVALTFDDGFRDNVVHALPVLERHAAPFTVFVTSGFADRTARLWWVELEAIVRRLPRLRFTLDGVPRTLPAETPADKDRSFAKLAGLMARRRPGEVDDLMAYLTDGIHPSPSAVVDDLCLSWDEIERLASHPLAAIGCHTATHANLALLDLDALDRELGDARQALEERLGRPVRHLAYPFGGPHAAGAREFAAAAAHGFAAAVTTRPGVLFPGHAARAMALPRISINGLWQDLGALDVLLSGAAFALWNPGRRLSPD
ncbi:polysaccharide deacetylase family protein [Lichenifustis flavocetrariae]|uniref:Chitooligosaccharide deacetylase n=1 Tax=Lichenifustis flavocetrariae TaxID=2949735 RepID=A0AA41Z028_9HYPH|nr:polysaccharide deacetylase family protein [Lichenifustis flavocetrariae]MCW6510402.1 polysaccharide deacetylase family protein [Lichenifustis flavocetrariae]